MPRPRTRDGTLNIPVTSLEDRPSTVKIVVTVVGIGCRKGGKEGKEGRYVLGSKLLDAGFWCLLPTRRFRTN